MPAGLQRYYGLGHLHFLTCSCYHRQPWLASPGRRDLFVKLLEEARRRYRFVVVGYVVMPEHIHLLISEPEKGTPSTVMQVVKQRYAQRVLRKRMRNPAQAELWPEEARRVWQRRFYDFNVWSEAKRMEKLGYMHWNPVKAEPEQWERSSYRSYADEQAGVVKINQWPRARLKGAPAA